MAARQCTSSCLGQVMEPVMLTSWQAAGHYAMPSGSYALSATISTAVPAADRDPRSHDRNEVSHKRADSAAHVHAFSATKPVSDPRAKSRADFRAHILPDASAFASTKSIAVSPSFALPECESVFITKPGTDVASLAFAHGFADPPADDCGHGGHCSHP